MQPSRVALELCRGRLQAMLLDPYADPLWDTEPCLQRAAQQAAAKNRSLAEIFEATLKSRDHNVLMTALTGMYARLEGMGTCCFFFCEWLSLCPRCSYYNSFLCLLSVGRDKNKSAGVSRVAAVCMQKLLPSTGHGHTPTSPPGVT